MNYELWVAGLSQNMNKKDLPKTDVILELHVPDFQKVKDFYGKLGFEVVWETPQSKIGYMVIKKDDSILAFYCGTDEVYDHRFFKRYPKSTPRGYGVEVVIYTDSIDEFYKEFIDKLGEKYIVEPLIKQRWGKKDFRIMDPFGFYVRFSEPDNILISE